MTSKNKEKSLAALVANEAPSAALLKEEENVGSVALLEGVQRSDEQEVFLSGVEKSSLWSTCPTAFA